MWEALPSRVRLERSRSEVQRTRATFDEWFAACRAGDALGQYVTQLTTLKVVLEDALQRIAADIDVTAGTAAEVHARCEKNDTRTALVVRAWDFYRAKVDQRRDPRLAPLLAAADEVAWSLYTPPFVSLDKSPPAAPLPYIEAVYAPRMLPRADPPRDLKRSDEVLASFLTSLPVPLVALPAACLDEPWLLTAMGHEIGHHVHYDLLDDYDLIGVFDELLASAASKQKFSRESYRAWSKEIFADAYSAVLLGAAAHLPVLAFEGPAIVSALVSPDLRYPPGKLRSALLASMTVEAGAASGPIFAAPNDTEGPEQRSLQALARAILDGALVDGQSLKALTGWDANEHGPDGPIAERLEQLVASPASVKPETTRSGARRVLAASAARWWQLSLLDDTAARQADIAILRSATLSLLSKSREAGTRSAPAREARSTIELGAALWDTILRAELP